ncbi:TAF12 family protein [Abortiporus biennis]
MATPNNQQPLAGSSNGNGSTPNTDGGNSIIAALGAAFKNQHGDPVSGERIAQLLLQNMSQLGELMKQGKLNQQQIMQLKEFADKHKAAAANAAANPSTASAVSQQPAATSTSSPALKSSTQTPLLSESPANLQSVYPISQTVNVTSSTTPAQWPASQQGRPTLTGGVPSGRVAGTPVQVAKPDDASVLTLEDTRVRRKNSPGDQSMRRSIQDLVSSIDPNVKIEPEVEDLLLDIADEFIDSVTNFGCRLAKHRGGDSLEVRDLQLHLERNHNIRIPGFASDETRISFAQTTIAPAAPPPTNNKKGGQSAQMTLRSHRLAQVAQAKREAKLM